MAESDLILDEVQVRAKPPEPEGWPQSSNQYLRRMRITLGQAGSAGNILVIDESGLRVVFRTTQYDGENTPALGIVRIYNMKDETVSGVIRGGGGGGPVLGEYTRLIIEAGYHGGEFGIIFDGTIKQFRKGRENQTETYFDINAGDNDIVHSFGVINTTLPAGQNSGQQQAEALAKAAADAQAGTQPTLEPAAVVNTGVDPQLLRGKVYFGMFTAEARKFARNRNATWAIENGKFVVKNMDGYSAGTPVVLMPIGAPEQTNEGITVRILLNPSIRVGQRVQINNRLINQTIWAGSRGPAELDPNEALRRGEAALPLNRNLAGFPGFSDFDFFAAVTADGIYRVLVIEHIGDSRGNDWYSDIVCVALDPSGLVSGQPGAAAGAGAGAAAAGAGAGGQQQGTTLDQPQGPVPIPGRKPTPPAIPIPVPKPTPPPAPADDKWTIIIGGDKD